MNEFLGLSLSCDCDGVIFSILWPALEPCGQMNTNMRNDMAHTRQTYMRQKVLRSLFTLSDSGMVDPTAKRK